jgi:hypothetical protein
MADEKHEPNKGAPVETGSKEAKLEALREAYPEELEVQGDKLRGDARRKGASPEEAERAANRNPPTPPHG